MEPRPHDIADGTETPLLAEEPPPPGSDLAELVDKMDEEIRGEGSAEIEQADADADAEAVDSDDDPTDDGREQDAPPA